MTQPPPSTPPPAGFPPAGGGFAPPSGPNPHGYAPPTQPVPPTYAGIPHYPAPPVGWAPHPGLVPPPLAPSGQPLAGFGDRLLAWLIDTALATALAMLLAMPVVMIIWYNAFSDLMRVNPDGTVPEPDPDVMMADFVIPLLLAEVGLVVLLLVFYWLYHVEYMHRSGQTLGKKIMKIKVVPVDPARTLTRGMAGKRYLIEYIAGTLIPFLSYLDGLWQLWDKPWQQCLHDKFADTVVVKVAP